MSLTGRVSRTPGGHCSILEHSLCLFQVSQSSGLSLSSLTMLWWHLLPSLIPSCRGPQSFVSRSLPFSMPRPSVAHITQTVALNTLLLSCFFFSELQHSDSQPFTWHLHLEHKSELCQNPLLRSLSHFYKWCCGLNLAPHSHVNVLTPGTSECDLIWKCSHCRYN